MTLLIPSAASDQQVAQWIWRNLVPKSGQATTVQGELLRAVEKLRWEAQENYNMNWDGGFVLLLSFLEYHLLKFEALRSEHRRQLLSDIQTLKRFVPRCEDDTDDGDGSTEVEFSAEAHPYTDNDLYDRLESFVVAFSRSHPELIPHQSNPKLGR